MDILGKARDVPSNMRESVEKYVDCERNTTNTQLPLLSDSDTSKNGEVVRLRRTDTIQPDQQIDTKLHLLRGLHIKYILKMKQKEQEPSVESFLTQHLRISATYWGVTTLYLLNASHLLSTKKEYNENHGKNDFDVDLSRESLREWISSCQHPSGGFSPSPNQDPHITFTHYALLTLTMIGSIDDIDKARCITWIKTMKQDDGSFWGGDWGECDCSHVYSGVACLTLLNSFDRISAEASIDFIQRCYNYDGGFSWIPGGESHAAAVFCCLAALSICEGLYVIAGQNRDKTVLWLIERQTESGGFNGRPEKSPDVCYSFWILASLDILGKLDHVWKEGLEQFICESQDSDEGGIADRPEDVADIFHTFFGICGLSLLDSVSNLSCIHPVWAIPKNTVHRKNLPSVCLLLSSDDRSPISSG